MKRDSSLRQGRWVDFVEDETKVRKNLSRLIHTVQHMPSARFRKDANTLWNLVDELEAFQLPDSSTSTNCPKKSARKSFSRKYLDLRLYPSKDRSPSPDCNLKNQKQENKPQTFSLNNSKKSKMSEGKKKETDQNEGPRSSTSQEKRSFSKTKPDKSMNLQDNILPGNEKDKGNFIEVQVGSKLKGSYLKPRPKLQRFQPRKKLEGSVNCSSEDSKFKHVGKINGRKHVDFAKDKPNSSNRLKLTINKVLSRENPLENDQASMVKKLTSYWNNLLNKEVDDNELSSSHGSYDDPMMDLARSIYNKSRDMKRGSSLSRHRSESSVNILKNVDGFNNHTENKDNLIECLSEILSKSDVSTNIKYKKGFRLKEKSLNHKTVSTETCSLEMGFDKSCGDNFNHNLDNPSKVRDSLGPSFDIKTQKAIEVLEKLVRKLKRFSELPLTCDQITLSHSLRTLLCLMTATVLSSEEQLFDDYFELEDDGVEITGGEDSDIKVDLRLSSGYEELNNTPLTESLTYIDNTKTNVSNGNLQLMAVQGITMRKVEDALRYLALCKEYLWTEFLLSPGFNEEGFNNQDNNGNSPRTFTFVIEEEILFGEDCDEDYQCYFETESEEEEHESTTEEAYKSVIDFMLISLERLSDLTADLILHYWPDSVQDFVSILYQTLVSLLVWWVIMKEIFGK